MEKVSRAPVEMVDLSHVTVIGVGELAFHWPGLLRKCYLAPWNGSPLPVGQDSCLWPNDTTPPVLVPRITKQLCYGSKDAPHSKAQCIDLSNIKIKGSTEIHRLVVHVIEGTGNTGHITPECQELWTSRLNQKDPCEYSVTILIEFQHASSMPRNVG